MKPRGITLRFDANEMRALQTAASDAHMEPVEYARLMVLAAAGMGGVTEHLERAIGASFDVDTTGTVVRVKGRKR